MAGSREPRATSRRLRPIASAIDAMKALQRGISSGKTPLGGAAVEQFIGCDAHKKFSVFVAVNEKGKAGEPVRVVHDRQLYRECLGRLPPHSAIAVEASGSYGWLVDEMERAGHQPRLCNPLEAKR